jgi:hypothetical protein
MYQSRPRLLRVIALLTAGALLVGCSESGVTVESVDPTGSVESSSHLPARTSSQEASSTIATSPTSTAEADPSAVEAADRTAAEGQWIQSWNVYLAMASTPAAEREALAATVTVDPAKTKMLADAQEFDRQGLQTYGQIKHRVSWPQPINGANTALIDDCQDRSNSGSLETATGNKVTVGVSGLHYQGQLVRDVDGFWRVSQSFFLKDEPC